MNSITICTFLCFIVFELGSSTVYKDKQCPTVQPIPTFDFKGLLGTWYEQARYDNDFQVLEHCVVVSFSNNGDESVFSVNGIVDDQPTAFKGPIKPVANGTGILLFHSSVYKSIDKSDEIPVAILGLDNSNYLILYDCKFDKDSKKRHDYLWILSRSKTYGGETKAFVDNFLEKSSFVDKSKLIWQDFSPKSCNR